MGSGEIKATGGRGPLVPQPAKGRAGSRRGLRDQLRAGHYWALGIEARPPSVRVQSQQKRNPGYRRFPGSQRHQEVPGGSETAQVGRPPGRLRQQVGTPRPLGPSRLRPAHPGRFDPPTSPGPPPLPRPASRPRPPGPPQVGPAPPNRAALPRGSPAHSAPPTPPPQVGRPGPARPACPAGVRPRLPCSSRSSAAQAAALRVLTFRRRRRAPALAAHGLWRRPTLEGPSVAPPPSRRPASGGHEARPRPPALARPAAAAMSKGPEEVNRLTESTYRVRGPGAGAGGRGRPGTRGARPSQGWREARPAEGLALPPWGEDGTFRGKSLPSPSQRCGRRRRPGRCFVGTPTGAGGLAAGAAVGAVPGAAPAPDRGRESWPRRVAPRPGPSSRPRRQSRAGPGRRGLAGAPGEPSGAGLRGAALSALGARSLRPSLLPPAAGSSTWRVPEPRKPPPGVFRKLRGPPGTPGWSLSGRTFGARGFSRKQTQAED